LEEGSTMRVLRKKDERTETITVRVPSSVKAELDQLRERADLAGFDLNATMSESMIRLVKQVREELDAATPGRKANEAGRVTHTNGLTRAGGEHFPAASGSGGKDN
jgi:predicted transcriptional regulator